MAARRIAEVVHRRAVGREEGTVPAEEDTDCLAAEELVHNRIGLAVVGVDRRLQEAALHNVEEVVHRTAADRVGGTAQAEEDMDCHEMVAAAHNYTDPAGVAHTAEGEAHQEDRSLVGRSLDIDYRT